MTTKPVKGIKIEKDAKGKPVGIKRVYTYDASKKRRIAKEMQAKDGKARKVVSPARARAKAGRGR